MAKIYCYKCKYLKRRFENYFDWRFVTSMAEGIKWSEHKFLMPHALCRRKECFKIIDGKNLRFQGQAQLNRNNDCHYFKKKWWKFNEK